MLIEKDFDAGGLKIHYAEGPAGGVPLVLLHGITLRWQDFMAVLPFLTCRYHVYALDLRGHGRSGRASDGYLTPAYGADVVRFLREQVKEPAVILGHSLGADVAMWVAANAPDAIRAVILEEPMLYVVRDGRWPSHPIHGRITMVNTLLRRSPSYAEILAAVHELFSLGDSNSVGLREWAKSLSQVDPKALATLLELSYDEAINPDELLPKITAPLLILQGNAEMESLMVDGDGQRACALLAESAHEYRAEFGHDFHAASPLTFFELVTAFLESFD